MFSRKKPPQLSLHEELQQTYNDCCNLTIKYLSLEEQNRVEDALKGWKSLHTSLLFKIDLFDKQVSRLNNDELKILNELKEIRDQNIRHLIRVQLRMDEVNRRSRLSRPSAVSKSTNSNIPSMTIPSLRNINNPSSRSLTNNNSNPRSMLKSLRPGSSSNKASKSSSNSLNNQASQAANLSWQKPKQHPKKSISNNPFTEDLFNDFDQDSFEFNDPNWEKIKESPSPPNLIELDDNDDYFSNGSKLSQSMDDLTIKVVPSAKKISPPKVNPPKLEHVSKSTSDIHTNKPKSYIYTKPKPININQLMKKQQQNKLQSTKCPTKNPEPKQPTKPKTSPVPAAVSTPAQSSKKSNITYNYVKTANRTAKKPSPPKRVVKSKSPIKKTDQDTKVENNSDVDDILGAYHDINSPDVGAGEKSAEENNHTPFDMQSLPQEIETADTLNEQEQDSLISSIRGIDHIAAKQILNDIVVRGDEVYWDDIVGLESAKNSLKEAVVYPFLRPDLFKGLREPTRGMLLFGPPGTGKTMLARAVATESKSTFFSITSSSLTSKYLGESEKLVKALFLLAKKLSPSIVFIDEIDSLLSSRSDNENESSRRIKNEFLIQWSELSSAAAGRDKDEQDDRVLILGATNLPWSIDEAARRRFVKRQYIPLPEGETRKHQIIKLLKYQKNTLFDDDYNKLIELTHGFSGSDITALAKDSAMGPLRSLGDKLLSTPTEQIRPINLEDFKNSLNYIRPSVSSEGLAEYEQWAVKFGSSGV